VKDTLISGFVGTASGVPAYLAGAPWWVMLLAMFVTGLLLLASRLIDYREVYRLARLANSGSVKGREGIEWKASTEPAQPEPDEPEAPRPRRWLRRKPPPDSS
jgi:hypothetical protein